MDFYEKAESKMASAQRSVLVALREMTPATFQLNHFGSCIENIVKQKQLDWHHSTERQVEQQQRAEKNETRREREADRAIAREQWARQNLTAGMLVKMTGTRGSGFRKIIRLEQNQIVCEQLYTIASRFSDDALWYIMSTMGAKLSLKLRNQITSHSWDKVTHYGVEETSSEHYPLFITLEKVPT